MTVWTELLVGKLQSALREQDRVLPSNIVANSRRGRTLVDSLLEYATVVDAPSDRESFALEEVLEEVCANLADAIAIADAEVTWGVLPVPQGQRLRILRLLQNLVSNALKYARPGVPPAVRISATQFPGEWRIDVEDNGRGIAAEHVDQLFLPLRRFHGTEIPGTGLGLAIASASLKGKVAASG